MNSIRKVIDKYKDIALSDSELSQLMHGQANIVRYRDIKNYKTVQQLLEPYNVCFILYEWKEHYGHWCVLIRHDNLIEFFDPYSGFPDSEIHQIPEPFRTESGQDEKALSKLLIKYTGELSYNEYQFQKLDQNVKDCGRWCVIRGLLKDLPLEDFKKLFLNVYGDDIATILTTPKLTTSRL